MENIVDDTKYDLTEEEYKRCLTRAEMSVFMNAKGTQNPKSIFAVAQPGAGKTSLKAYLVNKAQDNGGFAKYIEFNPDEVSVHHEHYSKIIKEFPDKSFKILQRFTQRALDTYLRQRAVEIGCNIVQEGTFRGTQGYIDILEFQKNGGELKTTRDGREETKIVKGGYNIEINVLAVNRFESLLSCFEREQYFVENDLPPRAVTIENHDDSYEKMLQTIDLIEQKKLFNQMKVFKRGYIEQKPELIFIAGDDKYQSVSDAVRKERARQEREIFSNPSAYVNRIYHLKQKVSESNNESLLRRIDSLEKIFLSELEKYNESRDVK